MFEKDPVKRSLWRIWNTAYQDSKLVYGYEGSDCVAVQAHLRALCAQNGITPGPETRIVPVDPDEPMLAGNIAVVDKGQRAILVNIWKNSGDKQVYSSMLRSLQPLAREGVATCPEDSATADTQ